MRKNCIIIIILILVGKVSFADEYKTPSKQPLLKSSYKEFMDVSFGLNRRVYDRLPYWCNLNRDGSVSMVFAGKDIATGTQKWYFTNIDKDGNKKSKNKVIANIDGAFYSMLGTDRTAKPCILLPDGNVLMLISHAVSIAVLNPISGEILEKKTIKEFYEAWPDKLFNDNAGNIYLMLQVGSIGGPHYMKIYPSIDSTNVQYVKMPEVGANYHRNSAITVIGNDKIIVCYRSAEIYNNLDVRNAENVCGYFVMNFKNEIVVPPTNFNYVEYAFRKIPNAYLPHNSAYNLISKHEKPYIIGEGMDFYRLPDGQMILTITAFEKDHSLCLYQLKYDNNGKLIKPGKIETVAVTANLSKQYLQNIQTGLSYKSFYKERGPKTLNQTIVKEQVFWGYDNDGQLFWDCVPLDTLQEIVPKN